MSVVLDDYIWSVLKTSTFAKTVQIYIAWCYAKYLSSFPEINLFLFITIAKSVDICRWDFNLSTLLYMYFLECLF
jgi:hypothetical protein